MDRPKSSTKSRPSTADLLTWSEVPPPESSPAVSTSASASAARSHQVLNPLSYVHCFPCLVSGQLGLRFLVHSSRPSDRISKVLQGGQLTDEEAESLLIKKNCSGYKMKEMTGSGIQMV